MPQVLSVARDDKTSCDVIRQVFGLGGYIKEKMTSRGEPQCLHEVRSSLTFLTAARQPQIYTGFPFNSQDRYANATFSYIRMSRLLFIILTCMRLDIP